uniref:Ovule protein n=1 Tax=Ditylenchus dipsaci TaxID=166011 RepID=A0A915DY10_9BILA
MTAHSFLSSSNKPQSASLENKTIAQYRQNTASKSGSKCINPSSNLLSPVLEAGTPNQKITTKTKLATTVTQPTTKSAN